MGKPKKSVDKKEGKEVVKEKSKTKFLDIVLVLFIFLLSSVLVYLFLTDRVMVVGLHESSVADVEENDDPITQDEDEDLDIRESEEEKEDVVSRDIILVEDKAYSNSTIGISLDYPDGWAISEESLNYLKNFNTNEVKDLSLSLTILDEEQTSTFNYEVPFGQGHEFCVFEDSLPLVEGTLQNEYEGYREYEGEEYIYRIAEVASFEKPVCKCKRIEDGVGCNNWMNPGYVTFGVEDGVEESKLIELFDILESIEYTGDIYKNINEASSLM